MRAVELARTESRIKPRGRLWLLGSHICPQCRQLRELTPQALWGQKQRETNFLRSLSRSAYYHKEKAGVLPPERSFMSKKEKFPLYLTPEKKALLERRYPEDGSRSLTAFIENAIDFYLDYLSANNSGLFLPASVQSYLDGRLDLMEDRMASLLFKQAVELDMGLSLLLRCVDIPEEELRRQRARSVTDVKKTNGRVSLELKRRELEEDEWLD